LQSREGVPERHIDSGERHADQPLCPEQTEAARELARNLGWRELVARDERLEVADEVGRGSEGGGGVRECDAAAGDAGVGNRVGEDERGFGNDAAGGLVGMRHRDADGADAEGAQFRGAIRHHEK
jgi:hypothetical protein